MKLDLNLAYIITQIIFLEGILSIDNAAVLGAMVSVLPAKDKIPWPGFLKFLGQPVHRLLGGQRSAALKVGLLGASIFTWMILKEPVLKSAAYLVVFNIGAELLLDELIGIEVGGSLKFVISAATLVLFVVYARVKSLHVLRPVIDWVAEGMANVNELVDWALAPLLLVVKASFRALVLPIRSAIALFERRSLLASQSGKVVFDSHEKARGET